MSRSYLACMCGCLLLVTGAAAGAEQFDAASIAVETLQSRLTAKPNVAGVVLKEPKHAAVLPLPHDGVEVQPEALRARSRREETDRRGPPESRP